MPTDTGISTVRSIEEGCGELGYRTDRAAFCPDVALGGGAWSQGGEARPDSLGTLRDVDVEGVRNHA